MEYVLQIAAKTRWIDLMQTHYTSSLMPWRKYCEGLKPLVHLLLEKFTNDNYSSVLFWAHNLCKKCKIA